MLNIRWDDKRTVKRAPKTFQNNPNCCKILQSMTIFGSVDLCTILCFMYVFTAKHKRKTKWMFVIMLGKIKWLTYGWGVAFAIGVEDINIAVSNINSSPSWNLLIKIDSSSSGNLLGKIVRIAILLYRISPIVRQQKIIANDGYNKL